MESAVHVTTAKTANMTPEAREPCKLLNGQALNINPLTAVNAQQSPLLNLPPEIRNRIYNYVLGGNVLHCIDESDPDSRDQRAFNVCLLPDDDISTYPRCDQDQPELYCTRHCNAGCEMGIRSFEEKHILSLSLLSVCQSIYNESALLPFATNTFSLDGYEDVASCRKYFFPAQVEAIRSVIIREAGSRAKA